MSQNETKIKPKFRFSLFTNERNRPLSKKIALGPDGKPRSQAAAAMSAGSAQHIEVAGVAGVATIIDTCGASQAISLGVITKDRRPKPGAVAKVTTKDRVAGKSDTIARSKDFLTFEPGAGLLLFDHDSKQLPMRVEMRVAFLGGVEDALLNVFPELKKAARIVRPSTSSGIINTVTGKKYQGGDGLHVFVAVADATDVPRALKAAHERLVLLGYGWGFVTENGAILTRSIVDAMVGTPDRLVFEGAPTVVAPLKQDASARRCRVTEGALVDTRAAFPDLTADERKRLQAVEEVLRAERTEEAERVRKVADARLVTKIVKGRGISAEEAKRRVAMRHDGKLAPEIEIIFDDPALGAKTVAEIYENPEPYIEKTCADPLAGVEYGRGKCKIFRDDFGLLYATSFAHGWNAYNLLPGSEAVERRLLKEKNARLVEVFSRWAIAAEDLWSVEEKARFRKEISRLSGVGFREITKGVREAAKQRHEQRQFELEKRQRASDTRVWLRPLSERTEEVGPLARQVDTILSQVDGIDKPLRDVLGNIVTIAEIRRPNFHELRSESEIAAGGGPDTKAPSNILIQRADDEQIAAIVARHVAFRDGDGCFHEPDAKMCKRLNTFTGADTAIPTCIGFQQLPLVMPDGAVRSGRAYDPKTWLAFRVDPAIDAVLPAGRTTLAEARAAYDFLANDWLADVATSSAGKAALVALALTLIERHVLDERPCFMISALQAKSGKTTAIRMVHSAVFGKAPSAVSWSNDETERKKALFALALDGAASVVFDNIENGAKIDSAALCAALTSDTIRDRILGASKTAEPESRFVAVFTGNRVRPTGDTASRCIKVDVVAQSARPEARDFRHPQPVAWTLANRGRVLGALYTILLLERTGGPGMRSRFRLWDHVVAHPVEMVSGVVLARMIAANEAEDDSKRPAALRLGLLHRAFGGDSFTAKELHKLLSDPEKDEKLLRELLLEGRQTPSVKSLGRVLALLEGEFHVLEGVEMVLKGELDRAANAKSFKVVAKGGDVEKALSLALVDYLPENEGESPF